MRKVLLTVAALVVLSASGVYLATRTRHVTLPPELTFLNRYPTDYRGESEVWVNEDCIMTLQIKVEISGQELAHLLKANLNKRTWDLQFPDMTNPYQANANKFPISGGRGVLGLETWEAEPGRQFVAIFDYGHPPTWIQVKMLEMRAQHMGPPHQGIE